MPAKKKVSAETKPVEAVNEVAAAVEAPAEEAKKTTRTRRTKKTVETAKEKIEKKAEKTEKAAKTAKKEEKPAEEKTAKAAKKEEKPTEEKTAKAAKKEEKPAEEKPAKAVRKTTTRTRRTKKAAEPAAEVKAHAEAAAAVEEPKAKTEEPAVEEPKAKAEEPVVEEPKAAAEEPAAVVEKAAEEAAPVSEETAAEAEKAEPVAEEPAAEPVAVAEEPVAEPEKAEPVAEEPVAEPETEEPAAEAEEPAVAEEAAPVAEEPAAEEPVEEPLPEPRRSIAFIGSECYPFVKTGGLGDVMYALPRALIKQNCDVKVILPRYKCIPWEYQEKMEYRGAFQMDLTSEGRTYYVGIMEYVQDGVVYDFIDNEEFFGFGNPYTNLVDDIPKFCFFSKATLAALNFLNWIPDIIHCHDWQAGLVPVYLRTMFEGTPVASARTMLTIHNLRFQGIYNIPTIRYWSGLPDYVFNKDALKQGYEDANMFKGGLAYTDMITTVSGTYAAEIQTPFYGENLDAHLRYHSGKLRGIVNGIDTEIWNPRTDGRLTANYDITDVLDQKRENKRALQEELGLAQDDHMFVIGLISRLTDQKGLDLVNAILPQLIDGNTQVVVLGTGDAQYENSFRYYEDCYRGTVCSNIMYDEGRAHRIYAGADTLLVPSLFEPCGLTQLIAMRYGTVPIVRETGGLKDTVQPYNEYTNEGNGFTFDRYEAGLLLDAINRAKTLFFTNRWRWDEMVQRDMDKDVSWEQSAKQYRDLYLELKP